MGLQILIESYLGFSGALACRWQTMGLLSLDIFYQYSTSTQKEQNICLFSGVTGTFSRIDHILGHKTSLNTLNNEIMPSIFSDHNQMKLKSIAEVKLQNLNVWKLTHL